MDIFENYVLCLLDILNLKHQNDFFSQKYLFNLVFIKYIILLDYSALIQ